MEDQASGPGFFAILSSIFLLFVLYVVIGFAFGLGLWLVLRLFGSNWDGPGILMEWVGRQAEKIRQWRERIPANKEVKTEKE